MRKEKIRIWEAEEYSYGMAYGFVPNLTAYLHRSARRGLQFRLDPGRSAGSGAVLRDGL